MATDNFWLPLDINLQCIQTLNSLSFANFYSFAGLHFYFVSDCLDLSAYFFSVMRA